MSSNSSRKFGAITAAGLAALFVACGGDDAPTSTPATTPAAKPPAAAPSQPVAPPPSRGSNVTVEGRDAEGNPVRFSGTDGRGKPFEASIGDDAKIPASFPSDVPVFPASSPMAAMTAEGEGTMVTLKSTEEQQKIYEYYQTQLTDQGWTLGSEQSFGGQMGLEATKDKRKVTVTISGTRGDSRISVIVMDES